MKSWNAEFVYWLESKELVRAEISQFLVCCACNMGKGWNATSSESSHESEHYVV